LIGTALSLGLGLGAALLAGVAVAHAQQKEVPKADKTSASSDLTLVRELMDSRAKYQASLEQLRAWYLGAGDVEKARWAEEELRQYHRVPKQAFRLELVVPPPTLQASVNVPEANELYRRAMAYKDRGWGNDYIDNQRRAELLLQQLVNNYPQCDKIGDAAYQLGDIYESRAYKQYRLAASYFERAFQWNKTTQLDARLRAARLYDRNLIERKRARELYQEIITHDTDEKRRTEAQRRLNDLGNARN
jgi:hypothetical protein